MKKLGLLSVTGLTMLLGLVNVNTVKKSEALQPQRQNMVCQILSYK